MNRDIILAGVGGQGILSIAACIGMAARHEKLYVKQSEVHGMSQRGGEVQAHLRLSSRPIDSDLISEGKADLILSMEPMEALRYVNYLKPDGIIITNSIPFINIENYPDLSAILKSIEEFKNHVVLDTEKIARKCGTAKASNMVLLGAAADNVGLKISSLKKALRDLFSSKGQKLLDLNLEAFSMGRTAISNIQPEHA